MPHLGAGTHARALSTPLGQRGVGLANERLVLFLPPALSGPVGLGHAAHEPWGAPVDLRAKGALLERLVLPVPLRENGPLRGPLLRLQQPRHIGLGLLQDPDLPTNAGRHTVKRGRERQVALLLAKQLLPQVLRTQLASQHVTGTHVLEATTRQGGGRRGDRRCEGHLGVGVAPASLWTARGRPRNWGASATRNSSSRRNRSSSWSFCRRRNRNNTGSMPATSSQAMPVVEDTSRGSDDEPPSESNGEAAVPSAGSAGGGWVSRSKTSWLRYALACVMWGGTSLVCGRGGGDGGGLGARLLRRRAPATQMSNVVDRLHSVACKRKLELLRDKSGVNVHSRNASISRLLRASNASAVRRGSVGKDMHNRSAKAALALGAKPREGVLARGAAAFGWKQHSANSSASRDLRISSKRCRLARSQSSLRRENCDAAMEDAQLPAVAESMTARLSAAPRSSPPGSEPWSCSSATRASSAVSNAGKSPVHSAERSLAASAACGAPPIADGDALPAKQSMKLEISTPPPPTLHGAKAGD
eukprot:CAMPEP_0176068446 /NCGR_PEP_ID=MMETSP0120_2-20121206/34167_1 /TAXON_ID=160619 /ORGANISM="Kryptoperidinium foliaceum, Strain CCMP 1326" /LENGTH=530 /DNA_ID=CAMNT_0017402067 /DNA_START=23 /DNA_END=1612 /DNA_ORIENTATION=+